MSTSDIISWIIVACFAALLVWGFVGTARDDKTGPEYLKLCGVIVLIFLVFCFAQFGMSGLLQSVFSISEETAGKVSQIFLYVSFLVVYFYFRSRRKR